MIAAIAVAACGDPAPAPAQGSAAREIAAAIQLSVERAAELSEPYQCAAFAGGDDRLELSAGTLSIEVEGRIATVTGAPRTPVVGFVADARGAAPEQVERVLAPLRKAKPSVVVSLGGLATQRAQIEPLLAALADGPWLLVAIPGDRESLPEHRAAVASLRATGRAVVDGAAVRIVKVGRATIGTFPGVEHAAQLVAESDGCQHQDDDATQLAAELKRQGGVVVWAGYSPPRQHGEEASDVGASGVHIGELRLRSAIDASGASLVVHGLVDRAARGPLRGRTDGSEMAILGTGALDPLPVYGDTDAISGAALIATLAARVRWRRIRFGVTGKRASNK